MPQIHTIRKKSFSESTFTLRAKKNCPKIKSVLSSGKRTGFDSVQHLNLRHGAVLMTLTFLVVFLFIPFVHGCRTLEYIAVFHPRSLKYFVQK
jgi:hypothetical protein